MLLTEISNEKYKFTGGNDLTGLGKLYHEIMMKNELRDGFGAYELSYAKGKSGLSFGGNQMDMSEDQSALSLLRGNGFMILNILIAIA